MAKPLRPKRGTTAKNDAFVGLASEITVDTEKHSIRVHDGVTAGGHEILPMTENEKVFGKVKMVNGKSPDATGNIPFTIGQANNYGTLSAVNLNTLIESGVYSVSEGTAELNFPVGSNGILVVYSSRNKANTGYFVRQIFYRIGTVSANDYDVYTRTLSTVDGGSSSVGKWYQVITSSAGTFNEDIVFGTDTMVIRQSVSDKYTAIRGGNAYANGASLVLYGKDATDTPGAARFIAHNGSTNLSLYCYPDGRMTWAGRELSSFAMPSGTYTALTFGATNTTYTAPSDGWFQARMNGSTVGQYIMLTASNGLEDAQWTVNSNWVMCRATVPVKKGDTVTLAYTCDGTNGRIRFYPANGVI